MVRKWPKKWKREEKSEGGFENQIMRRAQIISYGLWLMAFSILSVSPHYTFSQAKITTVGIQIKPIFPVSFLGTGTQSTIENNLHFDTGLKSGFSGGMLIRKGISDLVAIEAGINYVKRSYEFTIKEGTYSESSSYRIIGYEVPLSMLVYIRLGEQLFMNASMGISADMYASNVQAYSEYYKVITVRRDIFQPAIIANLGWEWRTAKSGFFYIGSSFHRPFNYEFVSHIMYERNSVSEDFYSTLSGSYLTIDFRYFFHEEPQKTKND
jgi:hypothetical protein